MYQFKNVKKPHIYLFGAGGTGGFLLENVTRLFAGNDIDTHIEVFDGDTVEPKNLKRQAFTVDDLDRFKTDALIDRLQRQVMNPPKFTSHTEFVTDTEELMSNVLMLNDDETPIFVLAVDNIETRRQLNQLLSELADIDIDVIALDCGNNDQGGQVALYANYPVTFKPILGEVTEVNLPTMLELFPEIDVIRDDSDRNPGLVTNCAENAESKPQAMMANKRNADIMANILIQIAQNKAFDANLWISELLSGTTTAVRRGVNE